MIFIYSLILVLTELIIRYTGLNTILRVAYIACPAFMILFLYLLLIYKFKMEQNSNE